jgi:hypothetical protein
MDSARIGRSVFRAACLVLVAAAAAPAEDAEKYLLRSQQQPGSTVHVDVAMQVGGDLKLVTEGKQMKLPMSVVANLKYDEQVLAVDPAHLPTRAIRYYDEAGAVIKVEQGGEKPSLGADRRLIAAELADDVVTLYSPTEALNRQELDLIDVPGGTMVLDRLLPAEPVALGE